jgi:hypothetical protein
VGFGHLYTSVTAGLGEADLLRVNAVLGLEGAAEAYSEHKSEAASYSGFEVG